ncbi:MAG: phosphotransferase [Anaerolineae bacterium]
MNVPSSVSRHTGAILRVEHPRLGANYQTAILTTEQGRYVLKLASDAVPLTLLDREAQVLVALATMRPFVPEVIAAVTDGARRGFLFSYLPGETLVDLLERADEAWRRHLLGVYGRALRRIHSWAPDLPRPSEDWLDAALTRARERVAQGAVADPIEADSIFDGREARSLLGEIQAQRKHFRSDVVFCHGDYCLPNVLAEGQRVVGVIDWSNGGYADRRLDVATALWTIRFNLHDDRYLQPFLDGYGYRGSVESLRFFEALYCLVG